MVPDLFPELIIEILNRLPVRDRARFRCVCKSWRTLISHVSLQRIPNFLICSQDLGDNGQKKNTTTLSSYDSQGNLLRRFHKNISNIGVVFTCLDFVCLVDYLYDTIFLCNPTTLELVTLPDTRIYTVGFGYAASIKEFKVLRIVDPCSCCRVFTVGTNDWRVVQDPPFLVQCFDPGAFANGYIQFLPYADIINGYIDEIASFNVETKEWGRVALPPIYSAARKIVLRELGGCLSLVVFDGNYGERSIEIWLLKNLEWVKEYCFNLPSHIRLKAFVSLG